MQGEHKRQIMSPLLQMFALYISPAVILRASLVYGAAAAAAAATECCRAAVWQAACLGCTVALGTVNKNNEQLMTGYVYILAFSLFQVAQR